ncbi:MAG: hypothetical protein JNK85_20825 [Verrucomicrobiales bacterium]|nr:hypothetical protein [Verrucomicrobiales bacterium]
MKRLTLVAALFFGLGVGVRTDRMVQWWQGFRGTRTEVSSAQSPIPVDHLFAVDSLSEIEHAKAWLDALATQSIVEARRRSAAGSEGHPYLEAKSVIRALEEISSRAEEFRGTQQEFRLRNEQFILLDRAGRQEDWISAYLNLLYSYPTHELSAQWAPRALKFARELNRIEELQAAWRHAIAIPREFSGKTVFRALLDGTAGNLAKHSEQVRPAVDG